MELDAINKQLDDFKKTLKPVKKGQTTIKSEKEVKAKTVEPPVPFEGAPPVPTEPGKACWNPEFVHLINSIKPEFKGNEVEDLLLEFLGMFPQCGTKMGAS